MKYSAKNLRGQRGQIALVMVLVMVVMMTLGVSIAQRSLFDVKLSKQEEESGRAFQAAETGVEEALRTLSSIPVTTLTGDTTYNVSVAEGGQKGFATTQAVDVGEVLTADLSEGDKLNPIKVHFFEDTGGCSASPPAIEIVVVKETGSGIFSELRSVVDADISRVSSNNFDTPDLETHSFDGKQFCASYNVQVPGGVAEEIRVRPYYVGTVVGIEPVNNQGVMPIQYSLIRSVGETGGGTARAVEVQRTNLQPPSILDYVLFSGADLAKAISGGPAPTPTPTPTPLPGVWWNPSWQFRKPMAINSSQVSGSSDLVSFPMLMSLTDANLAASAQADGDDIVFTDYFGVKLDHEIESFDASTGALVAWVRIPSLSPTSDTQLYMYFGNEATTNQQNPTGVWIDNFVAVHHLEESTTGPTDFIDSTSNGNDSIAVTIDGSGSNPNAAGLINGAVQWDGVDDEINIGSRPSINDLGPLTVTAWVDLDNCGENGSGHIVDKGNDLTDGNGHWTFSLDCTGGENFATEFKKEQSSSELNVHSVNNVVSTTGWYHVAATWDGGSSVSGVHLYVNAAETAYGATFNGGSNHTDAGQDLRLGSRIGTESTWDGIIDDIQISSVVRSADWLQTSYNNQNAPGSFYSVGACEEVSGGTCPGPGPTSTPTPTPVPIPSWKDLGSWTVGCDQTISFPAVAASQFRFQMASGGGGDNQISLYCLGSDGASWLVNASWEHVTNQTCPLRVGEWRETNTWSQTSVDTQRFSVGCNDGETMNVDVDYFGI